MPRSERTAAAAPDACCSRNLPLACRAIFLAICAGALYLWLAKEPRRNPKPLAAARIFQAQGVVKAIDSRSRQVVISHEAIPSYMGPMTMPFNVRDMAELDGLHTGDRVAFKLSVTQTESWVDHFNRLATGTSVQAAPSEKAAPVQAAAETKHPLLSYAFTNELGQPVALGSFEGQALAITFFFTRCPIPDFCPRLSRNFAEASQRLSQMAGGPTNWHFISVTFDPDFDTPPILKAYAQTYQYDPTHWSFLTGPKDKIAELARLSNVQYEPDSGLFNHNFRTMIIDATGRLQMVFPVGGNLSQDIVSEMIKAAAADNHKQS